MLWEIFAFTGLVFWCWLLASLLLIFGTVRNENTIGWPVFFTLASGAFVLAFTDYRLSLSFEGLAYGIGGYLTVGVFFTCVRWYFLVRAMREYYDKIDTGGRATTISEDNYRSRQLASHFHADSYDVDIPPPPSAFKSRITLWLAYWPFAVLSWVVGDLLADLMTAIYNRLVGTLTSIGRKGWGG